MSIPGGSDGGRRERANANARPLPVQEDVGADDWSRSRGVVGMTTDNEHVPFCLGVSGPFDVFHGVLDVPPSEAGRGMPGRMTGACWGVGSIAGGVGAAGEG